MAENPIYLVRHGRYEKGNLTEAGRSEDAPKARDALVAKGIGGKALVLSSSESRAVQTAEIIAEGLGAVVVPSKRIAEGGNHTHGVKDLDEFVAKALAEAGLHKNGESLVVVSHAPMLAVAKGLSVDDYFQVDYGEIVEYAPGTWRNPDYMVGVEMMIEDALNR